MSAPGRGRSADAFRWREHAVIKGPILSGGVMGRGCRAQPGPDITRPCAHSSVLLRAPEGH